MWLPFPVGLLNRAWVPIRGRYGYCLPVLLGQQPELFGVELIDRAWTINVIRSNPFLARASLSPPPPHPTKHPVEVTAACTSPRPTQRPCTALPQTTAPTPTWTFRICISTSVQNETRTTGPCMRWAGQRRGRCSRYVHGGKWFGWV